MISPRLPASPVMRCVLAFSIGVCILIPAGLIALLLAFRHHGPQWPLKVVALTEHPPAVDVAESGSVDAAPAPRRSTDSKSSLVSSQIAEMVASSQQQSAEENLNELDMMSRKLNSVASDKSVDDLTNSFQHWMGLESRASQPQANTKITEFDIDSAQLHDVKRNERKPGKFEYSAVLIDARGSTLEIKLTEAEGQETYTLMQRIKANPLLEKIYRQIAMPLLDSLVQSARDQMKSPPPPRAAL